MKAAKRDTLRSLSGREDYPPGWDSNPSTWGERAPLLALAAAGLIISSALTCFQVGLIFQPWDPIFGATSSAHVIHSPISRLLPIPDASLGILGYAAEIAVGAVGGSARWRTHSGIVLLFGLIAFGLGFVSVLLLIVQGAVVDSWCTLCLISACISIYLASRVPSEALAAAQHVRHTQARGLSLVAALLGASAPARV